MSTIRVVVAFALITISYLADGALFHVRFLEEILAMLHHESRDYNSI
jgi:hypothetical protein